MDLRKYGYTDNQARSFNDLGLDDCVPGRVVADYGGYLRVVTPDEFESEIAGSLQHDSESYQLPKVGDFVALQIGIGNKATIRAVLPRQSEIVRKSAGSGNSRQVLAANVDVAFVVQALDNDFNLNRLERYSYQLRQGGIEPVFVFNKADKVYDVDEKLDDVSKMGVSYIVTTATSGEGVDKIRNLIKDSKTAVLLGSSGVGKSTLTNVLLGIDQQKTAEIRQSDSTGRHTTSHRELFVLPSGGMIIDTPGIRELQLWGEKEFLTKSFADIEELAKSCEYRNCSHTKELNCAIKAAVTSGALSQVRLDSYLRFKNELQSQVFLAVSKSIKLKKQRARRRKKSIQLGEKLADDSEFYD